MEKRKEKKLVQGFLCRTLLAQGELSSIEGEDQALPEGQPMPKNYMECEESRDTYAYNASIKISNSQSL